jgi:pimeloyl-ACP methyl ester carboxylesterase
MHQEVFELHNLLQTAKIPGPYVLVGQSIGGLLIRLFVEKYGSNVVGVVLVDPTHESGMLGSLRYGGWVRLREKATGQGVPEPRLDGPPPAAYNTNADYMSEEFQMIYLARKNNPQPLGDRPLIVLQAGKSSQPPGTPNELWKQLKSEKDEHMRDLAGLSQNSKLIIDPASTHAIHMDNPQEVAQAIKQVLKSAATGTKLSQ